MDELRHRVRTLENTGRSPATRHHWFRSTGSVLLILLASLLSLLAVVSVWVNSIVQDTDRYVATVGPLASNPDVQKAITNRVTTAVLAQVDVEGLVKELEEAAAEKGASPKAAELLGNLKGPITSGLKSLVSGTVERVVSSSAFDTVWVNANRRAHSAFDKAITGESDAAVSVKNGQVAIDVGPIVAQVKDRLVSAGFKPAARIPDVHTEFVVFASEDVGKIKWYLRVLEILGRWLPLIVVLIAAAGVYLAVHRRRALIGAALGVFAAMLLLGITLTVLRSVYLDHLPAGASDAAAGAVFDSLVKFLRAGVRAVGAVALVTAVGAFLVGPSRVAVLTRTGCRKAIGALRDVCVSAGLPLGAVGRFVHRYKQWIGGVILAVAAIVLFTWNYPTVAVVLWTLVIVLIAFAIREFLDSGTPDTPSAATPAA
ncbi:membrane protein [Streptomyces sp. MMG1533]|nr:membrane protein [Streptomyces sp. MMG1533]